MSKFCGLFLLFNTDQQKATNGLLLPADLKSLDLGSSDKQVPSDQQDVSDVQVQQRFGPRDLKALLKNLDKEIDATDLLLQDEIEKRKKYQVSSQTRLLKCNANSDRFHH